ncbi:MAG: AMP-binding protein [Syntrophus sp. (in: bacteria)]|nr:AMP-binding protein [Syntrophus sp. (in: bacteria)]
MNVAQNLERSAFYYPDNPVTSYDGQETTYRQLNEGANRIATALLKMGIQAGEHVGLCAPNSPEWLVFYFGILKTGAVAVTLGYSLTPDELRLLLGHSKPRFLFTHDDRLGDIQSLRGSGGIEKVISPHGDISPQQVSDMGTSSFQAVNRDRNDTAAILYTGGTTGMPKGVMATHRNINTSAHNVVFSEKSTEKDRALCFLPLHHVFGQTHVMNATVMSAGCIEILPNFDLNRVISLIEGGRVTKLFSIPTVYTRLLTLEGLNELMRPVRYCFSAAAAMAGEIVRQWKERTGLTISEGYGMTESASAVTYNHYHHHVVGSIGTPVPGVEVEIRDASGNLVPPGQEGEICIRGNNIMKGYLNNPEATRESFWYLDSEQRRHEDGWFRSGDVGVCDQDGYFFIVDRLKDMIITGGENVYPREVEEILYTIPEVAECAVIGLPDKEWGERVAAFIVPKDRKTIVPEQVKAFLKTRLAPFKVPKEYIIKSELPKSAAGKILKRELKRQYIEETA